ncbi:triosephosphate isomerase [Gibbsiella quercinecans]|uniref:Triosephosphate isomerase n=1 Tax=Gibbsiella quercinecans TaxID=929813 RepID=A0A250B5K8_9GAMM|nr:triose-phosphate isomerase [Gibbsiella quercinecans]ATA21212.1 triose-phosphate isomerase [Gibbsiella quercinecans]RLM02240.1 triose-phosphate isomerase [Gibbsiella quercinecans]TCT88433.1 triosephosphate isomerase [Gibbsiella quercinecans]
MKQVWLGTSWKMNKPLSDAIAWCETLAEQLPAQLHPRIQPFFIPPFTAIHAVSCFLQARQLPCLIGAQNVHEAESGAWTGEISASMLVEAGAALVELGHSERRAAFNETDAAINKKVHTVLRHGLRPLVCIGDSADEKHWQVSRETVIRQMKIALHGLTVEQALQTLVAYEPVWAIGEHGVPATQEEASEIHQALRQALCEMFGESAGQQIPLLYGGSVNAGNAIALLEQPDIDGLFIGRAAWDAAGYCNIVQRVKQEFILKTL